MAVSQIFVQTLLLSLDPSTQLPEVRNTIESWSIVDRVLPYVMAALLLISTFLFFRLQKSSTNWFGIYTALQLVLLLRQAITTNWLVNYGLRGAILGFGGLAVFVIALGYMLWLRKEEVLM